MARLRAVRAEVIEPLRAEHRGRLFKSMGDGFMAYFSYPVAHEDDAYRAVLTGLEIVDEIGRATLLRYRAVPPTAGAQDVA